jgi:hypothetical protein
MQTLKERSKGRRVASANARGVKSTFSEPSADVHSSGPTYRSSIDYEDDAEAYEKLPPAGVVRDGGGDERPIRPMDARAFYAHSPADEDTPTPDRSRASSRFDEVDEDDASSKAASFSSHAFRSRHAPPRRQPIQAQPSVSQGGTPVCMCARVECCWL